MILLQADLSAVESRIALAFTGDAEMLEIARARPEDGDMHRRNAALIFNSSESNVTKDQRYLGKKAVHAAQRGARGLKLSEELLKDGYVKTPQECDALIDTYLAHHQPLVDVFFKGVQDEIVNNRALTNTWGRVIWYDYATINDDLFREGYSFKLQSEASDLLLQWGLIPTWRFLQMWQCGRMHVPVHDSLLISCPPLYAYAIAENIKEHIERPRIYLGNELTVPVEFALGWNWAMQYEFKQLPSEREFTEAAYDCEARGLGWHLEEEMKLDLKDSKVFAEALLKEEEHWKREYDAPSGAFWICAACGKWGKNRVDIGDESCFLNAVLLQGDKPEYELGNLLSPTITNEPYEEENHAKQTGNPSGGSRTRRSRGGACGGAN